MKSNGLDTITAAATRLRRKHKIDFTGSPKQVIAAKKILAARP